MRRSMICKLAILIVVLAVVRNLGLLAPPRATALSAGCAGYPNYKPVLEDANEAPSCIFGGPGCYECMYPDPKGPGYFLCAEYPSTLMNPDCSDRIFSLEEIPPSFLEGPLVPPEDPVPPDIGTPDDGGPPPPQDPSNQLPPPDDGGGDGSIPPAWTP